MTTDSRLVNLRDLGGLPLVNGGSTRAGVLYRGDAPYPGDLDPDHVAIWPPATVLDLRSREEVDRVGYRWPTGPKVHHHPLFDAAAPDRPIPDTLSEIYAAMMRERAHRIAETIALVANSDGPVFVHCAVGKDRTGVIAAVLLLAAGVRSQAVTNDYLATEPNLAALRHRVRAKDSKVTVPTTHPVRAPVARGLFAVSADAIAEVVGALTSWPGGPTAWLVEHGAHQADIDLWRRRFTGQ